MSSPISKSNHETHKHTSSLPTSISANVESYYQIKSTKDSITLSANTEAFYNIVSASSMTKFTKSAETFIKLNEMIKIENNPNKK